MVNTNKLFFILLIFSLNLFSCGTKTGPIKNSDQRCKCIQNFDKNIFSKLNEYEELKDSLLLLDSTYDKNDRFHSLLNKIKDIEQFKKLLSKIGDQYISDINYYEGLYITFHIRNIGIDSSNYDLRENLYWYFNAASIKLRSFPYRDTLIQDKWVYSLWCDERLGR